MKKVFSILILASLIVFSGCVSTTNLNLETASEISNQIKEEVYGNGLKDWTILIAYGSSYAGQTDLDSKTIYITISDNWTENCFKPTLLCELVKAHQYESNKDYNKVFRKKEIGEIHDHYEYDRVNGKTVNIVVKKEIWVMDYSRCIKNYIYIMLII